MQKYGGGEPLAIVLEKKKISTYGYALSNTPNA
jgi:hypothetical protein